MPRFRHRHPQLRHGMRTGSAVVMVVYILFLLLPIYWLVNMSFKTNTEITSTFTLFPQDLTLAELRRRS